MKKSYTRHFDFFFLPILAGILSLTENVQGRQVSGEKGDGAPGVNIPVGYRPEKTPPHPAPYQYAAPSGRSRTRPMEIKHVKVIYEEEGFSGWPANHGIWIWGNEILVGFVRAKHLNTQVSHTYDRSTPRDYYARSLDGGLTWSIENAFEHGQKGERFENRLGNQAKPAVPLKDPIDFTHPDLALTFLRVENENGPTLLYYSYNRGQLWRGPFQFPDFAPGTANRTDYLINGRRELFSFLSVGHGRVGVARTADGGVSWDLVSWIGPDRTSTETKGFLTMPSSIRLSASDILTTIRQREDDEKDHITSYLSEDNGKSWKQLADPVASTGRRGSPPALVKLKDGRLCLAYVFRSETGSRLLVRFSADQGMTWGKEIALRENDGANWDAGYPRMVQRPDGKLVVVYYWNHALKDNARPYRYIAATVFDADKY